ncbi:AHH domain-containing protein [Streptomyces sp. A012304]|uniref:AHH domain-containing protein n=1 Tax=Streptomyces sp. A012304 TaxID=375446 RepID=UPI0022316A1A|nr:AHH domain-containing protein [Streptomyces sp. A012304]GKQ37928.1 hypothetical protein ALMP_44630 [Streptomyces sp. A012304]
MSRGGDVLHVRPHLPDGDALTFESTGGRELPPDRRRALEDVLLGAVARAVESLQPPDLQAVGAAPAAGPAQVAVESVAERADLSEPAAAAPRSGPRLAFTVPADVADATEDGGATGGASAGPVDVSAEVAGAPGTTGDTRAPESAGQAAEAEPVEAVSAEPASVEAEPAGPEPVEAESSEPMAAGPVGPARRATVPTTPTGEARTAVPSATVPEPPEGEAGEPAGADRVVEGPSSLDRHIVMPLTGGRVAALGGEPRHVRARDLTRAIQLGLGVFGTTSFALLEGPVGARESWVWAIGTTPTVSNNDLRRTQARLPVGREMQPVTGGEIYRSLVDDAGDRYAVLAVVTKEHHPVTPDKEAGRAFAERMARGGPGLSEEETRQLVFGDLDQLVEQVLGGDATRLQEAADRLARLGVDAFDLVDWPTKSRYVQVLIEAWTMAEHERAVVDIMKSLRSVVELQAVRERLAEAHVAEKFFDDIGDTLWDLLITVGGRFGGKGPLTVDSVTRLFREAFALPPEVREAIRRDGPTAVAGQVARSLWLEVETAIGAVVNLLYGMVEGLALVLTRPAQVVEGLSELARLVVLFELAGYGYAPAQAECALLVKQIGPKLVAGLRGAALLHVGERAFAKVRSAVVVEVASWFVGIGEIKAAAEAAGIAEKLAVVARFLSLIGKVARTAEGELIARRLVRVARAMRAGSAILREVRADEEILRLLSALPAEDERRLGLLLQRVDVAEGTTLAELAAHPELGPAFRASLRKAEILQTLAAKSGGLGEELVQAFRRLAGPEGIGERELAALADVLKPGDGSLLLATLEHIGYDRIGPGAEVGAQFLTVLAAETLRMDAVREVGRSVVALAFERAAGDTAALDRTLRELARLQAEARRQGRTAALAELLEALERGDPLAWRLVAGAESAATVERTEVLARIKRLRARYRTRAANRRAMKNLLDRLQRLSKTDPALALEILVEFEARRPDRAGRFADDAELAAAFEDAARHAGPEEARLLDESDDIPADKALSPRDRPHEPGGANSAASELAAAMGPGPAGHDPHHIVADKDARAEVPRQILRQVGIEPRNSALNGVYLPRTSLDPGIVPQAATRHQTVHTNAYYKKITRELLDARREGNVHGRLAEIKRQLTDNPSFQGWAGFDEAESYADWLARHREEVDWLTDDEFEHVVDSARRAVPEPAAPAATGGVRIEGEPAGPPGASRTAAEPPAGPRIAAEPPVPDAPYGEILDDVPESEPAPRKRRRSPGPD